MNTDRGTSGRATTVGLVLGTSTGGIGRHVRSLAAGLVAAGLRVRVAGPSAVAERFDLAGAGAEVRTVEIAVGPDPVRNGRALAALRSALRGVDLVHAHGMRAGLLAALARPRRLPLVVTWHNIVLAEGLKGAAFRRLDRAVARATDIALCASDDMIGEILKLGGRDVRLAPVAAPPLPPPSRGRDEVRRELGAGDRPLLLSVGRLHPQKNYDLLVRAAARWRDLDPAPLLVIAGSGPSEGELAGAITAQGAPVTLLGHRTDVPDLLAACDLAVVSSRWEARQLFAQEALRAARPLVSTAVGGIPGLVGDAALLVPVGSGPDADDGLVDGLDAAVRRLLADDALRAGYAARGPARAATWPTEADTVDQVRAVYDELTG